METLLNLSNYYNLTFIDSACVFMTCIKELNWWSMALVILRSYPKSFWIKNVCQMAYEHAD